eukprot:scaffold88402_cov81-Phaeocystis_antarctica.AAC.1
MPRRTSKESIAGWSRTGLGQAPASGQRAEDRGRVPLFVQREFRVDFALLSPFGLIGGRDTALLPRLTVGLGPVVAFLRCRDTASLWLVMGLGPVVAFPR